MNRRGFLTQLFKGAIIAPTLPQIVTFGLHLRPSRKTVSFPYYEKLMANFPYDRLSLLIDDLIKLQSIPPLPPGLIFPFDYITHED